MLQFCSNLCRGQDEEFARMPANGITRLRCDIGCQFAKFRCQLNPVDMPETPEDDTPVSQTPTPSSPLSHATSPNLRLAEFPMDVASAVEIRHRSMKLPPLPSIPTPFNKSLLRGLTVGEWHMWKYAVDGLYYPGRINAVNEIESTFEYEIPSEIIYRANGTVSANVVVETFGFFEKTQCLDDRSIYSSQVSSNFSTVTVH